MLCLVDNRIPRLCRERLTDLGFDVVDMPAASYLAPPVASHPDMLVFPFGDKLFCHTDYYAQNRGLIDGICNTGKLSLVLSVEPTGQNYPLDVLFNCVALGDRLLCNTKAVSQLIKNEADARGYEILHTNQGYTKCSVCKVDERSIITSDSSIAKICKNVGMDVLLTDKGGVFLSGYEYGFIGGATGADNGRVYFCGSIDSHPDSERIKDFCQAHGKTAISLSDEPLYDIGSLIFI